MGWEKVFAREREREGGGEVVGGREREREKGDGERERERERLSTFTPMVSPSLSRIGEFLMLTLVFHAPLPFFLPFLLLLCK